MITYPGADISHAVNILRRGGIIVYPTETVYGIGCDPLDADACRRIISLKRRDSAKAMLLLACSSEQVESFAGGLDSKTLAMAERFWPGMLTMVIRPRKKLPGHLFGDRGGIAFRVTPHVLASALAREFGSPIIATSANISGKAPALTFGEAIALFGESADLVLESEERIDGTPSTVVDMTGETPLLIREGAIAFERILEVS